MKKLFLAITILFSLNGKAQDTTYYLKQQKLYMSIRSEITNPTDKLKVIKLKEQKRKRENRVFTIVTTTIFTTLSVWFFSGYHK